MRAWKVPGGTPNPSCRGCHGLGYCGTDVKTGVKIECRCVQRAAGQLDERHLEPRMRQRQGELTPWVQRAMRRAPSV